MKKFLLGFVFLAVSAMISATEVSMDGVLYYANTDSTMQVYEADEWISSVVIRKHVEYKGKIYEVNEIRNNAFQNCDLLTDITLPESILYIGYAAFSGCTDLVSINIPNSVKSIGNGAFTNCSSLTSINIPEGITKISAFGGCTSLKSVHLPSTLTSIGEGAFSDCKSLVSIDIPESVTEIEKDAFNGCTSLVNIVLPSQIKQVPWRAFEGCTSLKSVTMPRSVTDIGHHAFTACRSLESISIPDSVTTIDYSAFSLCTSLKEITIPNGVRELGANMFDSCVSLVHVKLPASIKVIGNNMFVNCTALESLVIPKIVKEIDTRAFENCYSLKHLVLPKRLTSLGNWIFDKCTSLCALTYEGTMEQWNAVQHEEYRNWYVRVVHCTDGDIQVAEYKTLNARLSDGLVSNRVMPEVAYPFSVSDSQQVTFSPGNLQYHPAKKEWRFALCQTDYAGETNERVSANYNGWVDWFRWGTGDNPVKEYQYGDKFSTFVDWGANQIGNDAPNTWRTMTKDEWYYLLKTRANAANLVGAAQVDGVNGIILLPDDWVCPAGVTFKAGFTFTLNNSDYAAHQVISAAQWAIMEGAGAIFLPAAGSDSLGVQSSGAYWSATAGYSSYYAEYSHCMVFNNGHASTDSHERRAYSSVRLVKDL